MEALIVITILAFLIGISFPITVNFYNARQFDTHLDNIVQSLREAQSKARTGQKESSFGVYFQSHSYVLFKGESYSQRDVGYDQAYELPDNILVTGLFEIVFSRIKAIPSETGDIVLTIREKSKTITVNEIGMINY